MGEINTLAIEQRAELDALARKAETGEQWAEICRREAEMLTALKAASGYLLNAAIDLETGATKATAINTINGGLKIIRDAIAKAEARS